MPAVMCWSVARTMTCSTATASGTGDDNAVDYLYGDFGDNIDVVGVGRDQLFGQGGNDLLFGEGEDDFIDGGAGVSNLVDYGSGESGTESDFDTPTVTPDPVVQAAAADPRAATQLPVGPVDYAGRWTEFAASATGDGISLGQGLAPEGRRGGCCRRAFRRLG